MGRLVATVVWGALAEMVERPIRKKQRKTVGHTTASAIHGRALSGTGARSESIQRMAMSRTALTTGT